MRNILIFGFVLLLSIFAFAKELPLAPKLHPLYEVLKTISVNYKPEGTVCEQVARYHAYAQFPPAQYDIAVGVEYDLGEGTVGELDMVVVNKATKHVESVAEIKCWHSFDNALDKAKVQQERFVWNLSQFPSKMNFISKEKAYHFTAEDFRGINKFVFISQLGGTRKGFHQELPYTLNEMMELRAKLVRCQNQSECPKP